MHSMTRYPKQGKMEKKNRAQSVGVKETHTSLISYNDQWAHMRVDEIKWAPNKRWNRGTKHLMQKSEPGKLNFNKDPLAKYEHTHSQATNIIWASTKKDNRKAWRMKIYVKNMVTKPENPSLSWAFLGCNPQKNGLLPQLPFLTLLFFPLFVSSSASHPRLLLHVPSGRPESSPPSVPFSRLKAATWEAFWKTAEKSRSSGGGLQLD